MTVYLVTVSQTHLMEIARVRVARRVARLAKALWHAVLEVSLVRAAVRKLDLLVRGEVGGGKGKGEGLRTGICGAAVRVAWSTYVVSFLWNVHGEMCRGDEDAWGGFNQRRRAESG